jgi:hypothetical protein
MQSSPRSMAIAEIDGWWRRVRAIAVNETPLEQWMFECSFSFMKSSLASSQSICASIAAANCGMALSRERSRTSMMIL